ncbi:ABC transporter substrate-binding protein [Ructibacterium gallinarum]|uniref:ABC transporter substrate-binding protein n=1 Tax=Ructibacterium gallinarum TaxID=2779355 RepID=A0A9D5M584_9FIRM|nr:ABC transporter substrate-binding protein [Ructibacterium gallinarum]MBE5040934.1 ABC transporter substrate-binding protein [Ructibacterium gallinarum]
MKGLKKVLAVLVSGVLAAGVCACGPTEEKAQGETPVITWYVPGGQQSDLSSVLEAINKITVEKIGASVDLQIVDTGAYQDRMTMMIGANDDFDLCFTSDWINIFSRNASRGAYLSLNEMLEKQSGLKDTVPEYLWTAATINGEIYAVPNVQMEFTQTSLCILKSLADKYHLDTDAITKVDDIEPFLEQVKQGETGIYPIKIGLSLFTNPIMEKISETQIAIRKDTGECVIYCEQPEYLASAKTIHEWYKKGYVRGDIASVTDDSQEKNAGKYAVWEEQYKPGAEAEIKARLGGKEVVLIPVEEPYLKANAGQPAMTAVGRNAAHPEKALELLELVNTDKELYNLFAYGVEGKHYTKNEDGKVVINQEGGYTLNSAWMFGNQFNADIQEGQDENVWIETEKMNNSAQRSPIFGFQFNTDSVKTEISQIASVVKEYSTMDLGAEDPVPIYDEFKTKMNAAGINTVKAELEKQLDEWKSGK